MSGTAVPLSGTPRVSYLGRLLNVLETAVDADQPMTLSDLAVSCDVPVSTASRLVALLSERGYLHREPQTNGYQPGFQIARLGLRTVRALHDPERLERVAHDLADQLQESVSVGLLVGTQIVLVARQESTHALRVVARVGDVVVPHTTAMGKALLAHLSPTRRQQVLDAALGPAADEVLATLDAELRDVRHVGHANDEQSYAVGQRCRAVAIVDHRGSAVGALSVAGPAARFDVDTADAAVPLLVEAAQSLSLARLETRAP